MKLEVKRNIASWILLLVFVPMLMFSSVHTHEEELNTTDTECIDCKNHQCHGHLQQTNITHDCLFCQFLSLPMLAVAAASIILSNNISSTRAVAKKCAIVVKSCRVVCLRAPPAPKTYSLA